MIERILKDKIEEDLTGRRALVLMGARQVGKTTLLETVFHETKDVLWLNGDEPDSKAIFESATSVRLRNLFAGFRYVVIDEAQRIPDIGIKLKLIIDQIPEVSVVATGSSSFDLANKVGESLAGRKWEHMLYPLSFEELASDHGLLEEKRALPGRLVYGTYPEVATSVGKEKRVLTELAGSILYKDILQLEGVKSADKLEKLLQALSYQIGNTVSYNELGEICGLNHQTAERYIDLLEKAYIVFRVGSFSRNLRNELKKSRKIYFYDNGIRNAVIPDFRPAEIRNDIGALWENYLMSERVKRNAYREEFAHLYFWRTAQQQEIDLVEVLDGKISAYEFKWNPKARVKGVGTFQGAYPGSSVTVVNRENYDEFLR